MLDSSSHLHEPFLRSLIRCRYVVYGYLLILLVAQALLDLQAPQPTLIYFLLAPVCLHILVLPLRRLAPHLTLQMLHWLEYVCMLCMLLVVQPPPLIIAVVTGVFVASNTALWGLRTGLPQAVLSIPLLWWLSVHNVRDTPPHDLLEVAALAGAAAFCLTICMLAHQQARLLLDARRMALVQRSQLLQYLPDGIGQQPLAQPAPPRRIWLAVAFVDLVDFTRTSQQFTDEALHEFLNDFFATTHTLTQQWGGSVSKFVGDGVLCVFAADPPGSHQNAAVQCVRWAAQLPVRIDALTAPLLVCGATGPGWRVRIGISCGMCTSGSWGGEQRWDYTVIGAPVNLASRLQSEAGSYGGVLMDAATAALVQRHIGLCGPFVYTPKGFAQQHVFAIASRMQQSVGCVAELC